MAGSDSYRQRRQPESFSRVGRMPPPQRRKVRFGTMRGRIHMKPGWDRPLTVGEFLSGEF
jgi:hypothetical protein